MREIILFSTTGAGTTRYPQAEEWNLDSYPQQAQTLIQNGSLGLNLRVKTMQFLEENKGINLCDLVYGMISLYMTEKSSSK